MFDKIIFHSIHKLSNVAKDPVFYENTNIYQSINKIKKSKSINTYTLGFGSVVSFVHSIKLSIDLAKVLSFRAANSNT